MLKALMIALGIALLLIADSFGYSKKPPPKIQPPSNQTAAPSASDQRGTDQVPLTVKILPTQGAKEKADKEDYERREKAIIEEKLAFETQRVADYTFWLSKFTLFLFCVAVLQACLFVWQLLYMRRGLKDATIATNAATASAKAANDSILLAKQTAEQQLRAYVSLKSFGKSPMVDTQTNALSGWELSLVWQNTGSTPTRDMLSHVSVRFEPDEIPDNFRFPDMWIIGRKQVYVPVSLAPNSTFIDGVSPISVAQLQEVRSGQKTLYLYCWADYNDVFPGTQRHRTEFCARVMLPGDPPYIGGGNIAFDMHWKHNGADDECMRKPITSVKRETIPDLPAQSPQKNNNTT